MHLNPSFFWSRANSLDHSNFQNYQSEQPSAHKYSSYRKNCKVSPQVHKLNDPQRSNLPVQTYQRVCQRMPGSAVLRPIPQEAIYNADETQDYIPPNSPCIENNGFKPKAQKVLSQHLSVASCKTTSCSRKSSIKSPERSFFNPDKGRMFDEEGFSRDLSAVFKTPQQIYKHTEEYSGSPSIEVSYKKQLSPKISPFNNYGSTKTHLLECPSKGQKSYYSQRTEKEVSLTGQPLTFGANTMKRVNIEIMKTEDDRDIEYGYDENGGFTTFRNLIDRGDGPCKTTVVTEGDVYENKSSTQRVRFICDGKKEKENLEDTIEFRSEEKRRWSQVDMKKSFMETNSARKCSEIKTRQPSIQWTPKDKAVGSLDVLSCSRTLFQSAKTERGNIPFKQERSMSGQYEDSEEFKLKKMIMEMKRKVREKDSEIADLKSRKKMSKVSNDELDEKHGQATMAKKRSDDILEQITQHIACQEREMTFLTRCNERLESILPGPEDYETNVESYLRKVRESEAILEQKQKEAQEMNAKVQRLEEESEVKIEGEQNKGRTEVRKLALELKVREQETKQLKEAIEKIKISLQGCDKIGEKMFTLEHTQNQHIIENDRLKNLLPEKEKKEFEKYLEDKSIASLIMRTSTEVNAIDDYARNLTKLLEEILKGKEPSVEFMKLLPTLKKAKSKPLTMIDRATLSRDICLKELTKANVELTAVVQQRFMKYMDVICEQYARACATNHCNVQ